MTAKTVLITGTSSGIGEAAVKYFNEHGWNVAATMRNPSSPAGEALSTLSNVVVLRLDVTDKKSIAAAITDTITRFGSLDAIVNNAGYGLAGPLELVTEEQLAKQYATNVFGPIYVMQAVLPHFRERGSGVICNITSVGGRHVMPLNSLYHGTKFALEGISESVALELEPFGIKVKIVEPGFVKTDFAGRSLVMAGNEENKTYDSMLETALSNLGPQIVTGSAPVVIAKVIYDAVTDDSDQMRYPAGDDAHVMLKKGHETSDEDHHKEMLKLFTPSK